MDPQTVQQVQEFWARYWYYILPALFLIGLTLGLIPFFLGRRYGQSKLGLIALIVTAVVGTPSVVFSLLSCAIFTIIILVRRHPSGELNK